MKIGINFWAFKTGTTLEQAIKLAKDAGFDGIELNVGEDGILRVDSSNQEVAELAAAIKQAGLDWPSVSTGLHWQYPLTSNDPDIREKGREIVRAELRIAQQAGANTILVVPGVVNDQVSYDVAYERAHDAFKALAKDAESTGVKIGVENVWNKFLLSPLEMKDFIDSIGSPMVGAYFDVGNVLVNGYPEQWIRILGKRIFKVHVKDFQSRIGNISGFTQVMHGDVNWQSVMAALHEIGYDDYITAEISAYKQFPDAAIDDAARNMRRIISS